MVEIAVYDRISDFENRATLWNRCCEGEQRFVPSAADVANLLQANGVEFRLLVAKEGTEKIAIACFVCSTARLHFDIGERKLFDLPINAVSLIGSTVLGNADKTTITEFFKIILSEWDFDVLRAGEILIQSPLHEAMNSLKRGVLKSKFGKSTSKRWLIRLPESFDTYLSLLRPTTRRSIKQYIRTFQKQRFVFQVIDRPEQIEKFLTDAESISKKTYQWTVGQQLRNDDATRQRYGRLARTGNLRCYIVYLDGVPCAFARGQLNGKFYNYETPGFDPQFGKLSPGLVLLAWVIQDLIDNTGCEVFDFGEGGGDRDYKSRFGTANLPSITFLVARRSRLWPILVFFLYEGLSLAKVLARLLLRHGRFRQWVKKAARQYGERSS